MITLDGVLASPLMTKALFEFAESFADQALVVSLASSNSVLSVLDKKGPAQFLMQARHLSDVCFGKTNPLVLHAPPQCLIFLELFRKAVESEDHLSAYEHLTSIRSFVAREVNAVIMPYFVVHLTKSQAKINQNEVQDPVEPTSLDSVLANSDSAVVLVLYILRNDRLKKSVRLWSHLRAFFSAVKIADIDPSRLNEDAVRHLVQWSGHPSGQHNVLDNVERLKQTFQELDDHMRQQVWPNFQQSDGFQTMKHHKSEYVSKSMVAALSGSPDLSGIVLGSWSPKYFLDPRPNRNALDFIAHCRWEWCQDKEVAKMSLIAQYPDLNANRSLPPSIAQFCFPSLSTSSLKIIEPRLFNLVLTDDGGERLFGCCLQSWGIDDDNVVDAICILSSRPEHKRLRAMLEEFRGYTPGEPQLVSVQTQIDRLLQLTKEAGEPSYDLPEAPQIDMMILFRLLHPLRLMELIEVVILERKALLLSSQLNILFTVCETLRLLLSPFCNPSVYIPVLPNSLVETLQCPTPFLIGMHQSMPSERLDMNSLDNLYVFDLDNDRSWRVGSGSEVHQCLPSTIRSPLLHSLQRIRVGNCIDLDFCNSLADYTADQWRQSFQSSLFETLLFSINSYIIAVPDSNSASNRLVMLFNAPAFIKTKPQEWHPFLHAFFSTSGFSSYISNAHESILLSR